MIPFDLTQVTSIANKQRLEPGLPAPTLHHGGGAHVIAIQDAAMPREKRQNGIGIAPSGAPMYTLDGHGAHAVAWWDGGDTAASLTTRSHDQYMPDKGNFAAVVAFSSKDHGSDAGDIAPTLRAMPHDMSDANGGGQVAAGVQAEPAHTSSETRGLTQAHNSGKEVAGLAVRRLTPL